MDVMQLSVSIMHFLSSVVSSFSVEYCLRASGRCLAQGLPVGEFLLEVLAGLVVSNCSMKGHSDLVRTKGSVLNSWGQQ